MNQHQPANDINEFDYFALSLTQFKDSIDLAVLNLNLTYDELSDLWQDKQRMHFEDDSKQLFKQIHAFKLKASKYKKHLKNLSTEFNLVANDENIDNNI